MIFENKYIVISECKHGLMAYYKTDDPIGTCLFFYGEWAEQEFDIISKLVNHDSNCIDLGANIGTHTVWFSRNCYNGFIFSIEPQFYIFQLLNTNIVLNDVTNCIPINSFIMNKTDKIKVKALLADPNTINKLNYGEFNSDKYADENGIYTNVIKLDDIDYFDKKINMIKMDCEGFEKEALLSGECLLRKDKPHMYLEFNSRTGNDELLYVLNDMGYNCYWHVYPKFNKNNFKNNNQNIWVYEDQKFSIELLDKFYEGNMICIHKDHDLKFEHKILKGDTLAKHLVQSGIIL